MVVDPNARQVGGTHYRAPIQHWDFVLANDIPYMEAQIIKYVMRWRKKNGIQDLEKARHFLEKLIAHEQDKLRAPGAGVAGIPAAAGGSAASEPYPDVAAFGRGEKILE